MLTSKGIAPPHGGQLVSRLVPESDRAARAEEARRLRAVRLSSCEVSDLIMIGMGAFSPLSGFMDRADYEGSVRCMHTADGTLWPIPITLAPAEDVSGIRIGDRLALIDGESDALMGTLEVQGVFPYDKGEEARCVFRTDDEKHPGVAKLLEQGDVCLAGPVDVLSEGGYPERFPAYGRPAEVRAIFEGKRWHTIAAFQTRNPLHRSHEYLTKVALEVCDGLFVHPIVGKLKAGDIPAEVRQRCYEVLLERYYPQDRVVLRVYPMEMRYGGPREAVLHAIIRQNYGCSHLCVGRDHAGVGSYYGPFEAQDIFDELDPHELHIRPLKFENTFWCYGCGGMASTKTCPHDGSERLNISGTKLREMLAKGDLPPAEFSRPEVLQVLVDYYQSLSTS